MNIVLPKFEEIKIANPLKRIERCARVCYKSESKITEDSWRSLICDRLEPSGHTAMFEHCGIYFTIPLSHYDEYPKHELYKILRSPYTKYNIFATNDKYYISTNLRVIYENYRELYDEIILNSGVMPFASKVNPIIEFYDYDSTSLEEKRLFVPRYTFIFTMDRIGSQSFCRHRVFSFAQESTRFCNYSNEHKFGHEISISYPCWLKKEDEEEFTKDMEVIENLYFKWIDKGYITEEARYFLPFGLKTEIVMTGFPDAWEHFFALRDDKHAHKQAQELAAPLKKYFKEHKYII